MINPAPYNAEAPPEALVGDITPTELHYVRSNFAAARRTTAPSRSAARSSNPIDPDARRPARDAGASSASSRSNAPATDAWRCGRCRPASPGATTPSRPPAGAAPSCTTSWRRRARRRRRRRPVRGRRPRRLPPQPDPPRHQPDDLTFVRALPLAHAADPARRDPDRLRDERRAAAAPTTAHRSGSSCPHWYAVASVKWLKRIDVLTEPYAGEFQTGHYMYQWADRPHETGHPHARARPDHRTRSRVDHPRRHLHRARQGVVRHRPDHPGRGQPHRRRRLAPGAARAAHAAPTSGRTGPSTGTPTDVGRHTLRARATDAAGNVQPDVPPWNRLGYGNNAIEVIYVDLDAPFLPQASRGQGGQTAQEKVIQFVGSTRLPQ